MSSLDTGIDGARMVVQGKTLPAAHALFGADMPVSGDHITQWREFVIEEHKPQRDLWDRVEHSLT